MADELQTARRRMRDAARALLAAVEATPATDDLRRAWPEADLDTLRKIANWKIPQANNG